MKKVVTFGEIMLRLAPPGFLRFSQTNTFDVIYGGGESNVAVSLANYGLPVDFVTRLPDNDIGRCALMEMRKRGVNTNHIVFGGERLGIYFLETGAVSRGSKVVYEQGPFSHVYDRERYNRLGKGIPGCTVVPLDRDYPSDLPGCCRCVP